MDRKVSAVILKGIPIIIVTVFMIFVFKAVGQLRAEWQRFTQSEGFGESSKTEEGQDESAPAQETEIKRLDVSAGEGREGELVFSFSLDNFIESFNSVWYSGKGEDYLPPSYMWSSFTYDSAIHSEYESVLYSFSGDEKIWSYPTLEAYAVPGGGVLEIFLCFDDHGYTDYLYDKYKELCFYTLKVFFPDSEDDRIVELYTELNDLAYEYFPEEHDFSYGAVPSVLYYADGVGLYPYFADGGTVKLCVIPVTDGALRDFEAKGTVLRNL